MLYYYFEKYPYVIGIGSIRKSTLLLKMRFQKYIKYMTWQDDIIDSISTYIYLYNDIKMLERKIQER